MPTSTCSISSNGLLLQGLVEMHNRAGTTRMAMPFYRFQETGSK